AWRRIATRLCRLLELDDHRVTSAHNGSVDIEHRVLSTLHDVTVKQPRIRDATGAQEVEHEVRTRLTEKIDREAHERIAHAVSAVGIAVDIDAIHTDDRRLEC